jgi:hypothetical protein
VASAGSGDRFDDLTALRDAVVVLTAGLAVEKARLAELRRRSLRVRDQTEAIRESSFRHRVAAAEQAEQFADHADAFADYLEGNATGQDRGRRLRMAQQEREFAAVERRNAARLRERSRGHLELEAVPPFDRGTGPRRTAVRGWSGLPHDATHPETWGSGSRGGASGSARSSGGAVTGPVRPDR